MKEEQSNKSSALGVNKEVPGHIPVNVRRRLLKCPIVSFRGGLFGFG